MVGDTVIVLVFVVVRALGVVVGRDVVVGVAGVDVSWCWWWCWLFCFVSLRCLFCIVLLLVGLCVLLCVIRCLLLGACCLLCVACWRCCRVLFVIRRVSSVVGCVYVYLGVCWLC